MTKGSPRFAVRLEPEFQEHCARWAAKRGMTLGGLVKDCLVRRTGWKWAVKVCKRREK